MSLAIVLVSLLSLAALAIVGGAAFVELRPVITTYRETRRQRRARYADETMRIYTPVRFTRARQGDHTGAIASLLLSLLLLAAGLWEWGRFDYGGEWRTVEGTITAARPEPDASGNASARARIEFRYTIGAQGFTSHWIDSREALLTFTEASTDFETRFRPGAPITVWYHPLLPTYPSIGRVTLWYVVLALGSGGFLLVSSVLTLLFARNMQQAYGAM